MVKLEGFTTKLEYALDDGFVNTYDLVAYGETTCSEIKYFNFGFEGCEGRNNLVFVGDTILEEVLNFIKTISGE